MVLLLKLLHIVVAIGFVAGIIGRTFAMSQARRTPDLHALDSLVQLGGRFDQILVIPCSNAVLPLGILTAWAEGWPGWGLLPSRGSLWLFVSLLLALSLIPIVFLIFLPRGRVFDAALKDALARGEITPDLQQAFANRAVHNAHIYEAVALAIIVILMVVKPF